MQVKNHVKFNGFQAIDKREHVVTVDPTLAAGDDGRTWYRSDTKRFRGWDGAAAHNLTNLIEAVEGSGALSAQLTGKTVQLALAAGSASGANTLVQRDADGNFSAATITAALNGLAADSSKLGGQTLAQVRDFAQTTGKRTALSAIEDFNEAVRLTRLDQLAKPTAAVDANGQQVINVADPTQAGHAATKGYVDSVATGLDAKGSVRMATTAALTANYANGTNGVGATLTATANGVMPNQDGITPTVGNRILVKNQPTPGHNGIYTVADPGSGSTPWVLTRATDADQAAEVTPGMFTFVEEGTTLARTGWVLSTTGAIVIGTTAQTFAQFSGAGTYLNGNGLSLTGTTFAVVGTANRITVGAAVDIASTYVGQTSITTLGTVTTGTWNANTIALARGGTGATTAAAARSNLGAAGKYAADLGAGTAITVTHNLNTTDIIVAVIEKSSNEAIIVDWKPVDPNNALVTFGAEITAASHRVVIVG